MRQIGLRFTKAEFEKLIHKNYLKRVPQNNDYRDHYVDDNGSTYIFYANYMGEPEPETWVHLFDIRHTKT